MFSNPSCPKRSRRGGSTHPKKNSVNFNDFVILIVREQALQEKKSTDLQKLPAIFDKVEEAIRGRIVEALGDRSKSDLARMTLESTANVSRYLRDKKISLRFFWTTALALGLNPRWLLTGEGPQKVGAIDWSSVSYDELQDRAEQARRELERNAGKIIELLDVEAASGSGLVTKTPEGTYRTTLKGLAKVGLLQKEKKKTDTEP
jgi:hypothetical protein